MKVTLDVVTSTAYDV